MRVSEVRKKEFREMIFAWWETHRRDLPWRLTNDPYRIMVSEVMLQQTQVSRVLPAYAAFLVRFPDVFSLARATAGDVLVMWKGMGYNRRALYLKKAAESVVTEYGGRFPDTESGLLKLPGLGIYTARAILVFAYKKDVAMVDTNIRQIITRFFFRGRPQKEKDIRMVADALVPAGKSWEWHQALMDYGSLALPRKKRKTDGKNRAVPFKETDRYFRGRVVDTLRAGPVRKKKLIGSLVGYYGRTDAYFAKLISGLERDGLLVTDGVTVRLPD